jgi:hypothetical protein
MEFTIDGHKIPMELVTYRGMGFSQPVSGAMSYQITLPRAEFLAVFGKPYEEFARDEKEDAPYRRQGQIPEHDRLLARGYPPLEQLLDDAPDLVEYLLRGRMALAWVLPALIPSVGPGYRFVINSIAGAKVSERQVVLEGEGFPA